MRIGLKQFQTAALSLFAAFPLCAITTPRSIEPGFIPNPACSEHSFSTQSHSYSLTLKPSEAVLRTSSTFRIQWLSGNPRTQIRGERPLPGSVSYFLGNDPTKWRTDVPRYSDVRYSDVYAGIDLVFTNRAGQLEYDWIVSPGADASKIEIAFPSADSVRLDSNGGLVITTGASQIVQHRPVLYQSTGRVAGGYRLHRGNRVTFDIAKYDRLKPLIIDPVLSYSTYLGGSGNDGAFAIAVDATGNAYVAGASWSPDMQPGSGLGAPSAAGAPPNAFVAKLNPAGTELLYLAYLGGSDRDYSLGIAVDESGNAYVTGGTNSTDFPVTPGAFQRTYGGTGGSSLPPSFAPAGDAFIAKLNVAGNRLIYSSYLGGHSGDQAYGIRVDSAGSAYVAGSTLAAGLPGVPETFPTTTGAFQTTRGGDDGFVAKVNADGTALLYSTFVGGTTEDYVLGLAVDGAGSAYITGITGSHDFPVTPGAAQTAYAGGPSAFVARLNPAGTALVYGTFLGGSGDNEAYGIEVDPAGNAYVTGATNSRDFPTTANAFVTSNRAPGAQGDVFAVKLNPAGNTLLYSAVFGGNGSDFGSAIAVDAGGNAYIAGRTFPRNVVYSSIPTTANAIQRCGYNDAFITKLDPTGSKLLYSSHLGGSGLSAATAIAVGPDSSVWVAGSTTGADFPVTPGAVQTAYKGAGSSPFDPDSLMPYGGDAFVAKMDLTGPTRLRVGCVVNGASFNGGAIAPGTIVSVLGGGMGPETGAGGTVTGGKVETAIAGTRVLFDGVPAPLLYARTDQINAVAPYGISGTTNVQVEYQGEKSNVVSVPVEDATPAIFTMNASGVSQGAVLNQDYSVNSPYNPADRGSVVSVYVTGLGRTTPDGVDGTVNDVPLEIPILNVRAYVQYVQTEVVWAGSAPLLVFGAFQVNVRVPDGAFPSPAADLTLFVSHSSGGGFKTQYGVTIAVR
jgi:uncharacterized protein (TIGR03437 family)